MARVIQSNFPSNVGLIVEVIQLVTTQANQPMWETKPAWPCLGVLRGVVLFNGDRTNFPDCQLRPIRPPETPVTETRDEELAA